MHLRLIITLLAASIFLPTSGYAQKPTATLAPPAGEHAKAPIEFDNFIVVLLVRPANAPEFPKDELDRLQDGHMSNMRRLAGEGKLFKAGPMEDYSGRNVRGIFIFATGSVDAAREWVATDPLIKAGRLVPEYMKWYVEKGSLK